MTQATWIAWGIMMMGGWMITIIEWDRTGHWSAYRRGAGQGAFASAFVLIITMMISN